MESLTISVIIPAYNEEKSIENVISRTEKILEALNLPYEVIVVDDGSVDKTRFLAQRHKVTVISNGNNYGKGYALRRGLKDVGGDIVITMDADGSHKPEDIKRLVLPLMNGADAVIGSRFAGKREKDSTKKLHIFGNWLFSLIIRILTKKHITDSQTGFRGFKRKVLEEMQITCDGYDVETELTVKTLKNGYIVREEPIAFEKRMNGCSHVNPLSDGIKILRAIIVSGIAKAK
jgi:glycosyltransferase involved in cell wall biosynthesis